MSRRRRGRLVIGGAAFALAAAVAIVVIGSTAPSPNPASTPAAGVVDMEPETPAELLRAVVPRVGPAGPKLLDEFGENEVLLEAGRQLSLIGRPVFADGMQWVRTYVLPSTTTYPGDFTAWLPVSENGQAVFAPRAAAACPVGPRINEIAGLPIRQRYPCFVSSSLAFSARTWLTGDYVAYGVTPDWYGTGDAAPQSRSLFGGRAGSGAPFPPDDRIAWLDVQFAPGVEVPPYDFEIDGSGQFGHALAATCQRAVDQPDVRPGRGLPVEVAADSIRWCQERFVVTEWVPRVGPEGRPYDRAVVQLHRHRGNAGCAGVGMGPLTFRIDPGEVDQVWLEAQPGGRRIIPSFTNDFQVGADGLTIVDVQGTVVIADGMPFNPEGPLGRHPVCPTGDVVYIG